MGRDKALIKLQGKTLLENAIEICRPLVNNILISSNNPEHGKYGYAIVPDEYPNCGPLSGIYSSLKNSDTDWNLILSVDAAYVEQVFIKELIGKTGDFDAIVPVHNNGIEPLVAIYHKKIIQGLKKYLESGDFKMQHVLKGLNIKLINSQPWIEEFPKIFCNLNRPEDFQHK